MAYIRLTFLCAIFFGILPDSKSQANRKLAAVIQQVSDHWKQDSTSCKGYRLELFEEVLNSQIDSTTKQLLYLKLGKPNQIQRFSQGKKTMLVISTTFTKINVQKLNLTVWPFNSYLMNQKPI